ncbi:uncharacterized protein METZ01_LOCUS89319 [marine metagenome]|uniref:Uncharacterized protein n=1 Tax=marine metagenome TaxID=408172 RepID=A0A381V7V7_9ZZZZ
MGLTEKYWFSLYGVTVQLELQETG